MNSREELKKTLNHQQPSRLVVDMGSTGVTGIHVLALERLRNYYGLEKRVPRVIEPYQMLGEVEDDLRDVLSIDTVPAQGKDTMFGFYNHAPFKTVKTLWGQEVLVPENFNYTIDLNGDWLIYPNGNTNVLPAGRMPTTGFFFDANIRQEPITEKELNVEDNLEEFGFVSDEDLTYWKKEVDKVYESGRSVIAAFGGWTALGDIALVPGLNLEHPKGIRDVTEWYMSTVMRTDYIKNIFDRQTDIAVENLKKIYDTVGNKVDVIFICGTDFGTQISTFCSPEQFDDLWLPFYKKVNDWIHANTSWKIFKHSCGAVESFMKKFIAAGFDIINPVQTNAIGMDPKILKEKYGKDLVFWGGGVDTQKVLPFGTKEEIREHVLNACEIFSKDGGFVFNTVHNIQANLPAENIATVFEAVKEFNGKN